MAEVQNDRIEGETVIEDETVAETGALLSRLKVIEDQPLDTRAAAFVQIHDRLQTTLEGGDTSHKHG